MGFDLSAFATSALDGLKGLGTSLLGGTEATGQQQSFLKTVDGGMASVAPGTPGSNLGFEGGKLNDWGAKNLSADTISAAQGKVSEGNPFDFNTSINNMSKLGNMYSTFQDQKMKKEYFNEWKKNNAYMKAEAEAQKKGRQRLARGLAGKPETVG